MPSRTSLSGDGDIERWRTKSAAAQIFKKLYVFDVQSSMLTIVETPTFSRLWPHYWTEEERGEFAAWLAENPQSGDVVRKSGGVRKLRWTRAGSGKSGGVRVVYFNRLANGEVWLLFMYAKAELDSIAGEVLREMKDEIEKAID